MGRKNIFIFIGAMCLLFYAEIAHAQQREEAQLEFRQGSGMLDSRYGTNAKEIATIKQFMNQYKDLILSGNGHIRLIAPIGESVESDPTAINLAALRAVAVRNYLKQQFRMVTDWSFTFYLDNSRPSKETIEVCYMPYTIPISVSSEIHCTDRSKNLAAVRESLSNYQKLPYLSEAPPFRDESAIRALFDKINALAANPVDVDPTDKVHATEKMLLAIHYRWDKDNLDTLYLSNPKNLSLLDSILTSVNSKYIDTLTIVASASPEGSPSYNLRLSERRARTIKKYITENYNTVTPERILIEPRGENWEGLRNLAERDHNLPSRDEVLKILDSPLSSLEKQRQLTELNGGVTYYRYLLPNYYRYLRNGASVLISYSPHLPILVAAARPGPKKVVVAELEPRLFPKVAPKPIVRYPVAFKTNLILAATGTGNLGVEFPIGKHWSAVGEFAYSFWQSSSNRHAFQTLQGGAEVRYWFGNSDRKKQKNAEWEKPLRGWNIGLHGTLCKRYDVQWIDGYQGDGFWSTGITGGYTTPIARNLAFEFTLGLGYFYTPEYRHYHEPEYNAEGKYHLMWQQTGSFGTFTLTKAQISLVWLLRSEKKGGKR